MNTFQKCRYTADAVPLYLPQQLYLKPIARITISVQLPLFKKLVGKSISNLEIMEKLRTMIKPEEFSSLRVTKSTAEVIRFEAEFDDRTKVEKCVSKLNQKTIKLADFKDLFKVRAAEWKSDFPNRHAWDTYFRDAKNMDDMKPGERPDTVYISGLPIKWFIPYHLQDEDEKPSEKLFYRVFEKFGNIRYVDIPICDPYRSKMKAHITGIKEHSFDDTTYFEGYVQFKDYIGFTKAMDAFRGMKLIRKDEDEVLAVNIKVDFDKTKHLTDASIRRREIVRDRLVERQRTKEEKEKNEKEDVLRKEEEERLLFLFNYSLFSSTLLCFFELLDKGDKIALQIFLFGLRGKMQALFCTSNFPVFLQFFSFLCPILVLAFPTFFPGICYHSFHFILLDICTVFWTVVSPSVVIVYYII